MHKKKVVNKELHAIRRYAQQHEQLSGQTEHQFNYVGPDCSPARIEDTLPW